ncbi:winged helix-turn-helix transcriptional regulator [Actinokineospora sp.]|uniref:winged helix-turn-helix transcriptional regulator n=1 Tax=Actinokineospora sp. TaxID=1872133 RepID=UPI0040379CA7
MAENRWKLVVDRQGVTIASDRFRLTATGPAPVAADLLPDDRPDDAVLAAMDAGELANALAELQSMTRQTYGQFCGLSQAAEMVGERWALLVIRDLIVGPKRFAELRAGLPRLSADILCARLRELVHFDVVRERPVAGETVYELTDYGRALEEVVLALGRWGALALRGPRPEDVITADSVIMALRACFRPEAAAGARIGFELRLGVDTRVYAQVVDGAANVGVGPLPDADLVLDAGTALKALLTGEVTPAQDGGLTVLAGDPALLDRFVRIFHIQPVTAALSP